MVAYFDEKSTIKMYLCEFNSFNWHVFIRCVGFVLFLVASRRKIFMPLSYCLFGEVLTDDELTRFKLAIKQIVERRRRRPFNKLYFWCLLRLWRICVLVKMSTSNSTRCIWHRLKAYCVSIIWKIHTKARERTKYLKHGLLWFQVFSNDHNKVLYLCTFL